MAYSIRDLQSVKGLFWAVYVFIASIGHTAFAWYTAKTAIEARAQAQFDLTTSEIANAVADQLQPKQPRPRSLRPSALKQGGIVVAVMTFLPLALISVWLSWSVSAEETRLARERFAFKISEAQTAIHQRLVAYEQVLRGGLGLFVARKNNVTREEWRTYARTLALDENFPGIQGIGFSRRILPPERDAHVRSMRAEGFPDYEIRPKGERTEYTSIIYLEPFDWRNQRAFGYDMFSEPVRHDAMVRARDSGVASISGKVILVQETDRGIQNGFLMYLPVYPSGSVPDTLDERREQIVGYIYAPFRMGDLLRGILGAEQLSNIQIEIFDGDASTAGNQLYDSLADLGPHEARSTFVTEEPLPIDGHLWTIRYSSLPAFDATIDVQKPRLILFGGLAGSALFAAVALSLSLNHQRANALMDANRRLEAEIIERTALEEQLKRAKDAAEGANRAKSAFLANMSHELRTPLNAILGYAQLLKRDRNLTERPANAASIIQRSGQHLLMLITDILDLSKIEAGKLELSPSNVSMPGFLQGITDIIRVNAGRKGVTFVSDISPDLPIFVRADEKRLRQVLLNLLGNAIKFTDQGEVTLCVFPGSKFLASKPEANADLHFEVRDTGVGISAKQLEAIFKPFEQACDPQRRSGGTGLGLSISQELVRLMGSEIRVESKLGQGSRFWFDLLLPFAETEALPTPAPADVTGYLGPRRSVLIVDDTPENRAVLADSLGGVGFDVLQASNGAEGIELAQSIRPDLILMDVMMPVMGGLEAIRRLREISGLQAVPIIAISASVAQEDQNLSFTAGADAFLAKPIELELLFDAIAKFLRLSWIHNPLQPAESAEADAHLIVPALTEIEILHGLARAGNMRNITKQADRIATLDERYRPFADKLRQLARAYDSKGILRLVEDSLDQQRTVAS